jgi:hypothetical protein
VIRTALAGRIDATLRFFEQRIAQYGLEPVSGSPASREQTASNENSLTSAVSDRIVHNAWAIGCGQLIHASDHLGAISPLIAEPTFAWAPQTLARGAIESASRGLWLHETDIGHRERVSRFLDLYYDEMEYLGRSTLRRRTDSPRPTRKRRSSSSSRRAI